MSQKISRSGSLLPFALPLGLVLVAAVLVLSRSDKPADVGMSQVESAAAITSAALDARVESELGIPARHVLRELPPSDERVAALIEAFHLGDRSVGFETLHAIISIPQGEPLRFTLAGMDISGVVSSRIEGNDLISMAVRLDGNLGRFTISLMPDGRAYSTLFFNGESHAFTFHGYASNGVWPVSLQTLDQVLCAPIGSTYPLVRESAAMPRAAVRSAKNRQSRNPVNAPPALESDPDSTFVLYIDLDGEVVDQPEWSDTPINALPHPRADDVDFVTRMWRRVSEDMAPFDINVTTSRAVYDAAAPTKRAMCIATPTDDAAPGAGGVAYLNSFGSGLVCWAFNLDEATLAETVSHEFGHTFGLLHDGKINVFEYYGGHGTGEVSWAPIMGAYFADFEPPFINEELTQWSKGEYPDATNQEDDLLIITSRNGFGYRKDDHPDTRESAVTLPVSNNQVSISGIIEKNTDEDWFRFATGGGAVTLTGRSISIQSPEDSQRGANLALAMELYDNNGKLVASAAPQDRVDVEISQSLSAGTYFVKLEGAGRGDLVTGFSNYASLGQYTLTGTVPQSGVLVVTPELNEAPFFEDDYVLQVKSTAQWRWSCDADWVISSEPRSQTGNQEFRYSLKMNSGKSTREALINFTVGNFTISHRIIQEASNSLDDHGDTMEEATLILQDSLTEANLEQAGDIDVFRIEVTGFGTFSAQTQGDTPTRITLRNRNGKTIASGRANSSGSQLQRSVEPGTYFVSVSHALAFGVGPYELLCSLRLGEGLFIDSLARTAGPGTGRFLLQVQSSRSWSWSSNVPWITSSIPRRQAGGLTFNYTVAANTSKKTRKGAITFTNGRQSVVHRVSQTAPATDDHSNTRKLATFLPNQGSVKGRIGYEGDKDMFRIKLPTSGRLDLRTTGSMETVGELLDSKGNPLITSSSGNRGNFRIVHDVNAGTYYVRVSGFAGVRVGNYEVRSNFSPSKLIDLRYRAGRGGRIRGVSTQTVVTGSDGLVVRARPRSGYEFSRWSDGLRKANRVDRRVVSHLTVTAEFVRKNRKKAPAVSKPVASAKPGTNTTSPVSGLFSGLAAPAQPWVIVSPDGYFRYRFERPASDHTEQSFWVSPDGQVWEEALVLDVWKTHTNRQFSGFEAILAPPVIPVPRILVSESAP